MRFLLIAQGRLLAGLLVLFLESAVSGAPANDNFADRIQLHATTERFDVSLLGSTIEANELLSGSESGGGSVWWTWTAVSNGVVDIGPISPPSIVGGVQVFHSSPGAMPTDSERILWGGLFNNGAFPVILGQTYAIRIFGSSTQQQTAQYELSLRLTPANDHFVNRTILPPNAELFLGSVYGATAEGSESEATVWWAWTPAISGHAAIQYTSENSPAEFFTMVVWRGNSWEQMYNETNLVTFMGLRSRASMYFPISASQPYAIRLSGYSITNVTHAFKISTISGAGLLTQPQDAVVKSGGATYFHVYTPGIDNTNVTWQLNGAEITNVYGATLPVFNANATNAGIYRAIVKNGGITTLSREATLAVQAEVAMPMKIFRHPDSEYYINFGMEGPFGTFYELQMSLDLESWTRVDNQSLFNPFLGPWLVSAPEPPFAMLRYTTDSSTRNWFFRRYFRAVRMGDFREACIVNLRRQQLALEDYRIRLKPAFGSLVPTEQVDKYFSPSELPRCPQGGVYTYSYPETLPTCSVAGHTL
jgi:hypothetical protein